MANKLNIDLKSKYVILSKKYFKGTDLERLFLCESGFGCSPFTMGCAIFGTFVTLGIQERVEGNEIERLAEAEEIELARKTLEEKIEKKTQNSIGEGI